MKNSIVIATMMLLTEVTAFGAVGKMRLAGACVIENNGSGHSTRVEKFHLDEYNVTESEIFLTYYQSVKTELVRKPERSGRMALKAIISEGMMDLWTGQFSYTPIKSIAVQKVGDHIAIDKDIEHFSVVCEATAIEIDTLNHFFDKPLELADISQPRLQGQITLTQSRDCGLKLIFPKEQRVGTLAKLLEKLEHHSAMTRRPLPFDADEKNGILTFFAPTQGWSDAFIIESKDRRLSLAELVKETLYPFDGVKGHIEVLKCL